MRCSGKRRSSSDPLTTTITSRPYPHSTRTHPIPISPCGHTIQRGRPQDMEEGPATFNNGTSRAVPSATLPTPVYTPPVRAPQASARQHSTPHLQPQPPRRHRRTLRRTNGPTRNRPRQRIRQRHHLAPTSLHLPARRARRRRSTCRTTQIILWRTPLLLLLRSASMRLRLRLRVSRRLSRRRHRCPHSPRLLVTDERDYCSGASKEF
jgi:hypothetical protein